jgi:hypothetical protein
LEVGAVADRGEHCKYGGMEVAELVRVKQLGADAVRSGWARSSQLVNAAIECDDITLLDVLVVQYRQG